MNDLRSPLEDRPYRPSQPSPRLAQDDVSNDYEMSFIDRVRYSRWFPLGSVVAAVLIFSGIISYAYKQGTETGVNATTPVVSADAGSYKEKPENPGGMDVPFQDAVVFDQLQNQENKTEGDTIESLLPPPEQPVASTPVTETPAEPTEATKTATAVATAANEAKTSETAAAPTTTANAAAVTETINQAPEAKPLAAETDPASAPIVSSSAEPTNLEAPAAKPVEPVKPEPKAVEPKTVEKLAAPKPVEKSIAKPEPVIAAPKPIASPEPTPAPAAAAVSSGAYRIQLGAFRDESAARNAWSAVQKQFSQLSGVTPAFPRADLGAKGIFYRAQGTNLSKESADSLCRTINASKAGSCIVTH